MFIVMAGLPGTGKSTIAEQLGRQLGLAVVSVDPIESAILSAGIDAGQPTGLAAYLVAERIADSVLSSPAAGVIIDAVNAVEPGCAGGPDAALAALAPGVVLAPIDLGPRILTTTAHRVLAAPYHRNAAGNRAAPSMPPHPPKRAPPPCAAARPISSAPDRRGTGSRRCPVRRGCIGCADPQATTRRARTLPGEKRSTA